MRLQALCATWVCCATQLQAAPPLQVALGERKLPYVSAETPSGVEYDLITQTLHQAGYPFHVHYMPNKRAQMLLEQNELDVAISTSGHIVSQPYILYQNMAITLCERQITLTKIADLTPYQVGAFHNASQFLCADFLKISTHTARYRELSPQKLLNRMLLGKHIDVAISDINIFKQIHLELDPTERKKLCPYALFPPTVYRLAFRDSGVRDRFNQALNQLRAAGIYERLARQYQLPQGAQGPYFKP